MVSTGTPTSPITDRNIIGSSETLISSIIGSSASSGRSGFAWSTLSRTRWCASVMSSSGMNSMRMTDTPSEERDSISFTPESPVSLRSIGMVTSDSMSLGATPS